MGPRELSGQKDAGSARAWEKLSPLVLSRKGDRRGNEVLCERTDQLHADTSADDHRDQTIFGHVLFQSYPLF